MNTAHPRPARPRSARGIRIVIALFVLACLIGIAWLVPRVLEATFALEVEDRLEDVRRPAPMTDPAKAQTATPAPASEDDVAAPLEGATLDESLVELLRLPPLEAPAEPAPTPDQEAVGVDSGELCGSGGSSRAP